jgi:ribosomal protein S14
MTGPQFLNSEQQVNLRNKYKQLNRWSTKGRAKNFCLILGKARTYNRRIFLSRQAFRELVSFGLISGISN